MTQCRHAGVRLWPLFVHSPRRAVELIDSVVYTVYLLHEGLVEPVEEDLAHLLRDAGAAHVQHVPAEVVEHEAGRAQLGRPRLLAARHRVHRLRKRPGEGQRRLG